LIIQDILVVWNYNAKFSVYVLNRSIGYNRI